VKQSLRPPEPEPVVPKETAPLTAKKESTALAEKAQVQETGSTQEKVRSISEEQVIQPAEEPVVASVRTFVPQIKAEAEEIPKLKDPDMKLQAVTWSKTPQKRIAVINNRILREGESVSGYLLSTINQDDVILVQDGIKWKLLFR
jgi:type II secretory pathway component PulC